MKPKEELTAVKEKAEAMNEKVRKLTDEELHLCSGGAGIAIPRLSSGVPELHDSSSRSTSF